MIYAKDQTRRDEIKNLTDDQVLDYWSPDERTSMKDKLTSSFTGKATTPTLKGSDSHPSFHEFFTEKEIENINTGLKNISTVNQDKTITAFSDIQVKKNGGIISIQNAIFNTIFPAGSNDAEKVTFDPSSIKITGATIKRDPTSLDKHKDVLTVTYKKLADEDDQAAFYTKDIDVSAIVDNNEDANKIRNLFRVADYGSEDISAKYAAGLNDNTLDRDGKPDLSRYMVLTSTQNKNAQARYFRIRYFDKNPTTAQRQVGLAAPAGIEVAGTTTTNGSTNTTYKSLKDLTGGQESFTAGQAYIEELIPDGKGNFQRVIVRKPNSDQLMGHSSWGAARLYLKDIYENSPYWEEYHENRFIKKDEKSK